MKQCHKALGVVRALAVVGMLSFGASRSDAVLLNLSPDVPDFTALFVNVSYDATTDSFSAIGSTAGYDGGSATLEDIGDYTLTATISSAGFLSAGTLTIEGNIGSGVETLLTGSLNTGSEGTAFGSTDLGGGLFEFLFTVTGGVLSNDFGGVGAANGGIILGPSFSPAQFDGTWDNNFNNDPSAGYSDNFVQVPEPSSFLLLVLGTALCVATHRSRKHTRAP